MPKAAVRDHQGKALPESDICHEGEYLGSRPRFSERRRFKGARASCPLRRSLELLIILFPASLKE